MISGAVVSGIFTGAIGHSKVVSAPTPYKIVGYCTANQGGPKSTIEAELKIAMSPAGPSQLRTGPCHPWQDACLGACVVVGNTAYQDRPYGELKCVDSESPKCFDVTCVRWNYNAASCTLANQVASTSITKKGCTP